MTSNASAFSSDRPTSDRAKKLLTPTSPAGASSTTATTTSPAPPTHTSASAQAILTHLPQRSASGSPAKLMVKNELTEYNPHDSSLISSTLANERARRASERE